MSQKRTYRKHDEVFKKGERLLDSKLFSYFYLRNREASPVSWERNNQRT